MSLEPEYWKKKDLTAMNPEEWEALCDGCGKCCLFKFINPGEETVRFTNVVCRYMDMETCRCTDYDNRHVNVPDCIYLTPKIRARSQLAACHLRLPFGRAWARPAVVASPEKRQPAKRFRGGGIRGG
jgi:Uncharacterized conserved protein